ncbi:hypothetical protein ACFXPT_38850 [Streptomyces goshikiensis]|uniref:hypothetical protein n=1 Tax=Streptomyces goshikiensis TaxID=1942 RepID=UPI0036CDB3C7
MLKRHGWPWQAPARRALARDEHALEPWKKQVWPQVKGPRRRMGLARLRGRGRIPHDTPPSSASAAAPGPRSPRRAPANPGRRAVSSTGRATTSCSRAPARASPGRTTATCWLRRQTEPGRSHLVNRAQNHGQHRLPHPQRPRPHTPPRVTQNPTPARPHRRLPHNHRSDHQPTDRILKSSDTPGQGGGSTLRSAGEHGAGV